MTQNNAPGSAGKKGLFSDRAFNHRLISLTVPMAFQSLMLAAVAAADAIMLGRLDQNSMSSVSLATQIQFVMNMFIGASTGAGSILAAQYWGIRDTKTLDDIFNLLIRLNLIVDLVFGYACICQPEAMMTIFTNDAELQAIGAGYLRIAGWSYLLTGISQAYLTMMKVCDHQQTTALISSTAVVVNIALNSVFIFGLLGAPRMGARGAATATLISRVVEIVLCIVFSLRKGYPRPDYRRFFHRNRLLDRDFVKIAMPILGASLLWGVGFTSYTAVMGHLGQDAAAANSVAAVVRDLTCCMCNGVGSAAAIMLGVELGQGNMDVAKEYGTKLMKIGFLIGIITCGVVLAVIQPVRVFYRLSPEADRLLVGMLMITSVYMIGRCANTVIINGIFDGGGDTNFDVWSLALMMWCFAIPTAFLGAFVFHWPVLAVYACTCLDEVGKLPLVMHHFYRYKWLKNLTRKMEN
ncbi:MAG: MATE family efflux transporter [Lachnospiraceae bacterium]|jgi:putative MATE family efflux protein